MGVLFHWDFFHRPKNVSVYLLDNQELHEQRRITKPVVIWFNAAGPILGVPYKGGE